MGPDQLRDALILGRHSLSGVENSGKPVIFELKKMFGHKILFFYQNFNILNKIKRFFTQKLSDLVFQFVGKIEYFNIELRIIADCGRVFFFSPRPGFSPT